MHAEPINSGHANMRGRPESKHGEQAIERAQFRLLELDRITARALAPQPDKMRNPLGQVLFEKFTTKYS